MEGDGVKIKVRLTGDKWIEVEKLEWRVDKEDSTLFMTLTPQDTEITLVKSGTVVDSFKEPTGAVFKESEDANVSR